jgi:hypothetical protein
MDDALRTTRRITRLRGRQLTRTFDIEVTIFSHIARRQGLSFLQVRLPSLNQTSNDNTLSGVLWLKASAHCLHEWDRPFDAGRT